MSNKLTSQTPTNRIQQTQDVDTHARHKSRAIQSKTML